MKNITYIITHKESTPDRKGNLYTVLEWLNNVHEIEEVIIVEQGKFSNNLDIEDKGLNKNYKLTYKFINNPNNFFNKCWAFNVGAKMAKTNWLAFGDNDVIMNTSHINDSIKNNIESFDSFSPYDIVYDLTPSETNDLKNDKNYSSIQIKRKDKSIRHGAPYAGGIFFLKRDKFFEIGAWDERFLNWGAEDEDMTDRIRRSLNSNTDNKKAYHLHHSRNVQSTFKNEYYSKNLQLFCSKRDNKLSKYLDEFDINKIGLENKYSK